MNRERKREETWNSNETRRCSLVFSMMRQKGTSYFDKSRGSLLITGAHCDIQPSGIQGFNIIDTQQRGQHPRLLKESLSIECRTLLLYPFLKHSKLGGFYSFPETMTVSGQEFFLSPINGIILRLRREENIKLGRRLYFFRQFHHPNTYVEWRILEKSEG